MGSMTSTTGLRWRHLKALLRFRSRPTTTAVVERRAYRAGSQTSIPSPATVGLLVNAGAQPRSSTFLAKDYRVAPAKNTGLDGVPRRIATATPIWSLQIVRVLGSDSVGAVARRQFGQHFR